MKVDLHEPPLRHDRTVGPNRTIRWKKALPFLVNPRGRLIHRVRFVHTHIWHDKWSHDTAIYWCGNMSKGQFTDSPPHGRLICARCEANAVAAGEKTADELAGRHVCVGTIKVVRQCCTGIEN